MERTERNDWIMVVMFFAIFAMGCGSQGDDFLFSDSGACVEDTETYTETVTAPDGTDADTLTETETATTDVGTESDTATTTDTETGSVEAPACWELGTAYWCAPTPVGCAQAGGTVTAHACAAGGACCQLPYASVLNTPGQCNGYLGPDGLCWLYPQMPGPKVPATYPEIYSQNHAAWCAATAQLGHDDWREATVDELRPFIVGCPASEVGGACVITEGMIWDWALVADGGPCAGCESSYAPGEKAMPTFRDGLLDFITSTTVVFANGTTGHIYISPWSGRIGVVPGGVETNAPVTPRCVRVPVSGEGT
jgi:hypothetical protein